MPKSPYLIATCQAIETLIRQRAQTSKFGLFLSDQALSLLVDDLRVLVENSLLVNRSAKKIRSERES